ncbi:MAG: hypothetical protein BWY95_02157 [Bacteroidetes bacterium ADurb.BinA104]|nr:MAG: hypothetical protein BWY95_02157 [Bacteroidetes bacterium ADurb.BinA104]
MEYEIFFPFAHLFAAPADHGAVIYAQGAVGYDKRLVYAYYASESVAARACAYGRVEREEIVGRLLELYAIGFKTVAECMQRCFGRGVEAQGTLSRSLVKCGLYRVGKAAHGLFGAVGCEPVNQQV